MKKIFIFIILFFIGINTSFATWKIDGDTVYPGGPQIITYCENNTEFEGDDLADTFWSYNIFDADIINSYCGSWEINNNTLFPEPLLITECSLEPSYIGELYISIKYNQINNICGENPIIEIENNINPLIELANNTGSGAINGATGIMTGPIGYIVYFILGLSLLGIVIYSIKKFFN